MQHLLFAAFLCVVFGDNIQKSIFEDGQARQDHFIASVDTTDQDGSKITDLALTALTCFRSFTVSFGESQHPTQIQSLAGYDRKLSEYIWEVVGEGEGLIELAEAICGTRIRVVYPESASISELSFEESVGSNNKHAKRQPINTDSDSPAFCPHDAGNEYVAQCSSDPDGPRCRFDDICGCDTDRDCYNTAATPYCSPTRKICQGCFTLRQFGVNEVVDHDWCADRYPGYLTIPGTDTELPNEWVAVVTDDAGVPQPLENPTVRAFETGTYPWYREVCKRDATGGRCVNCQGVDLAEDLSDSFNVPPPELDVNTWFPSDSTLSNFDKNDIVNGLAGTYFCSIARPLRPVCNHGSSLDYLADLAVVASSFDPATNGACQRCAHDIECVNPSFPFCDPITGRCTGCTSNSDCINMNSATPNCQADGSCIACTIGIDCFGSLNQNDVFCQNDFTCAPRVVCASNAACGAAGLAPNCGSSGECYRCLNHGDCGNRDLGSEHICNFDEGVCVPCASNTECIQTLHGPNCQANGRCITCATDDSTCGLGLDGGEFPNQPLCNGGVCTEACARNSDCGPTRGGNNCQMTGHCLTCVNTINNDGLNSCGQGIDGGEFPGQPVCDEGTGTCINDNLCDTNNDCAATPGAGANCQFNRRCVTCSGASCGTLDGGTFPNQPNCRFTGANAGQCVGGCSSNDFCIGTQGNNCMINGICRTCLRNEDCGFNDAGLVSGQTRCDINSGICVEQVGCDRNTDCSGNSNGPNCNKDGTCIRCTDPGQTCGNTDGGFVQNQPICGGNGICTEIDDCETNIDCQADATVGSNCMLSGQCISCTSSQMCGTQDGGLVPRQPSCNRGTGICEEFNCDVNQDCVSQFGDSSPNCQSDRTCRRCSSDNDCGSLDGGIPSQQPHCNRVSGICTSACTENAHCDDPCRPFCSLQKSCCVECLEDQHCPHPEWIGEIARDFDVCSAIDNTCAKGCKDDADCPGSLACRPATGTCVFCVNDEHCTGTTPACHVGSGECVACTADAHCPAGACHIGSFSCVICTTDAHCSDGDYCTSGSRCEECLMDSHCGEDEECVDYSCESSASSLAVGFFLFFFLSFYRLF